MWKILSQANRKYLAPKDNPQKLKIKLISSGVLPEGWYPKGKRSQMF
jgi:hypothetical protein